MHTKCLSARCLLSSSPGRVLCTDVDRYFAAINPAKPDVYHAVSAGMVRPGAYAAAVRAPRPHKRDSSLGLNKTLPAPLFVVLAVVRNFMQATVKACHSGNMYVRPGEVFMCSWTVVNTGDVTFPEGTKLAKVGGFVASADQLNGCPS